MSKIYGKVMLSALVAGVIALPSTGSARTPTVENKGAAAAVGCGNTDNSGGKARHMDKIVFHINSTPRLLAASQADQAALDQYPRNSPLDIKVNDNPAAVADLKGKVLSFIGAVDNADMRSAIVIEQVAYAVVCPTVQDRPT